VNDLTSEDRKTAIIFDDTSYYRDRSKKVELLSRFFDHSKRIYYKGFELLTMGWSDGVTFLPLDFRVSANADDKKLICGSNVKEDNRTLATKRRKNARKTKPELVLDMLKSIKGTAAQAKYVLFDSWFSSIPLMMSIKNLGFHVVARLKNNENFRYKFQGETLSLNKIFAKCRKRPGKSRYLLSVLVELAHKDFRDIAVPAKIVFVRDRANRKKWIAIISTDTTLTEDEIIALYGKRWDIEPFHKVIKSCLKLEKEFLLRSFDSINAHIAIVLTRFILLSLENRENNDLRSVNETFRLICDELEDVSFSRAFELILSMLKQYANDFFRLNSICFDDFVEQFLNALPTYSRDKINFAICES
jgi:hypothetical protein